MSVRDDYAKERMMGDFKDDCTDDLVNRLTLRGSLNSALEVERLREIEFLNRKRGALTTENTRLRVCLKGIAMSGDVPADLRKHANLILERVSDSHDPTG